MSKIILVAAATACCSLPSVNLLVNKKPTPLQPMTHYQGGTNF